MSVYEKVASIGVDVHYHFSTVSMRDAEGHRVRRERLEHEDRARLREVLARWPKGVPVVLEASFGWAWISDEMRAAGLDPALANCWKLEQMRKTRGGVKTNKKDADLLADLPFEDRPWWKVWIAPPEVRDHRELLRHRAALVDMQTQMKNRVTALFHRHGIVHEFSDLFGTQGRAYLAELARTGRTAQVTLPAGAHEVLAGSLKMLDHLRKQLAALTKMLRATLRRTAEVVRLDTAPGIGLILAHTIAAEMGDISRFRTDRSLAAYALLAPRADDTGEDDGSAPLGRHLWVRGNRTLKWAFIEAAHGAVRKGGKWRRIFDGATEGGRKNKGRGYIKVARSLLAAVHAMWRKGQDYQESGASPARPNVPPVARQAVKRSQRRGCPRPGTGQPYHPMAAVVTCRPQVSL